MLRAALKPDGIAIIGTFAPDGPERCSGLPVARHDSDSIASVLGPEFKLIGTRRHSHVTPGGNVQRFQFSTFQRNASERGKCSEPHSWPDPLPGCLQLDRLAPEAENENMKRAHRFALIIGVLLGLFGQTVTVAASPAVATAITTIAPAGMPMDCLGMMDGNNENSLPCARMTLACMAGMSCVPLLALDSQSSPVAEAVIGDLPPACASLPALRGRSAQPEQHPPNILA